MRIHIKAIAGAICLGLMISAGGSFASPGSGSSQGASDMRHHHGGEQKMGHGHQMGHGYRAGGAGLDGMLDAYDSNDDGGLTEDEVLGARESQLNSFDADGNGTLSIDEYEALWLDAMRERMVDRFQAHDDDGDGQVTVEEFNEDFEGFMKRYDRNGDGAVNSDDMRR